MEQDDRDIIETPCGDSFDADSQWCQDCQYYEMCLDEYEVEFTFRA